MPSPTVLHPPLQVICLCAQWCDTCREYRRAFDALAAQQPVARFLWVDIEDDEDMVGDVEVETFPTLLIAHGENMRFFGPLVPHIEVLQRLLQGLQEQGSIVHNQGNAVAQALLQRIMATPKKEGLTS